MFVELRQDRYLRCVTDHRVSVSGRQAKQAAVVKRARVYRSTDNLARRAEECDLGLRGIESGCFRLERGCAGAADLLDARLRGDLFIFAQIILMCWNSALNKGYTLGIGGPMPYL